MVRKKTKKNTTIINNDSRIVLLNKLMEVETPGYVDHKLIMSTINEMVGVESVIHTKQKKREITEYKRGPYYYNRSDNRRHKVIVDITKNQQGNELVCEYLHTINTSGKLIRQFNYIIHPNGEKELRSGWEIYDDTSYHYFFSNGQVSSIFIDGARVGWFNSKSYHYEDGIKIYERLY